MDEMFAGSSSLKGVYFGNGGGLSGAGGSGYISGHEGCIAINSQSDITPRVQTYTSLEDSYHYSGKVFTSTVMKSGKESMPNTSNGTETGHSGNGYARITYVGQ